MQLVICRQESFKGLVNYRRTYCESDLEIVAKYTRDTAE